MSVSESARFSRALRSCILIDLITSFEGNSVQIEGEGFNRFSCNALNHQFSTSI